MVKDLRIPLYLALSSLLTAGCSLGVVRIAPDSYLISEPGALSWSSIGDLTTELETSAKDFCLEQGKTMQSASINPTYHTEPSFSHAELRFRCVGSDLLQVPEPDHGGK